ncbi:MAG: sugar ABC transporter ATP-binding protein [Anaerolineae bacterium]|nr:sugar ABC transporter ATP-binding protein [Anaerolineae bacterium]
MADYLVQMQGIDKSFDNVAACVNCQFELLAGEVHALVGENGAGKSTLMKILAGVYRKDAGQIFLRGQEVDIHNPHSAQMLGITMIHQELNLMPHLTVAQNIFIGREPRHSIPFLLDELATNQRAKEILSQLHLNLNPKQRVGGLSVALQQMVEITKALSYNSQVMIMDEPTAALTEAEIEELFHMIHRLRDQGMGIVYISHRMEEIKRISDRVTVMRDGRYIETLLTPETTIDRVISLMVGRTIYESKPELPDTKSAEVVLEVKNLNRGRELRDVNFHLERGEILGFAGLMGAGRTEVARAIVGADPCDTIELKIMGKPVTIRSPKDAVQHGIGYLSEDRKRFGLVVGMDLANNVGMASMTKFLSTLGIINDKKIAETANDHVDALAIKTPSVHQRVRNLSGGNQQKVVIAKWLCADTDILIFDEPTRGIDVGAKSEIYRLLNELARHGKSIIMISSELPEILRMSHRIIVMCEGRITGELTSAEATQEKIMQFATQRSELVEKSREANLSTH